MSDHDIIPVILAGGAGRRLWPLSRQKKPKPFLSFAGRLSMFQDTLLRLRPFAAPIIICGVDHFELVAQQAAALNIRPACILLEPAGRNTGPAVTVVAHYIAGSVRQPGALMLAVPADHAMEDAAHFADRVAVAKAAAHAGHIVTFGITPDMPETRYGYIQKGPALGTPDSFQVSAFAEKPDKDRAKAWLSQGDYFWNSGMLLSRPDVVLDEVRNLHPAMFECAYTAVARATRLKSAVSLNENAFLACPDISIDVAVLEKTQRAAMVPLNLRWRDLGTWPALTAHLLRQKKAA